MRKFFPAAFSLLIILLPVAAADAIPLENLKTIGALPTEKTPDPILDKERNPFVRREEKSTKATLTKESEESKLRMLFTRMSVTGMIRGQGTTKVLLDNIILKLGEPIPPIMQGQTEKLMVSDITDKHVELEFVETEEQTTPRKIVIPIDIHPRALDGLPFAGPSKAPPSANLPKVNLAPPPQETPSK